MKKSRALRFFKKIMLIVTVFALMFKSYNANAQTNNDDRINFLNKKANNRYLFNDYNNALPIYLELLKYDSTKFLYNFRAGFCYLKSNKETAKSVKYFEAARKYKAINDGATFEFHYYMGYAYHITNRFDEAIESFTIAKTFPNTIDSIADKEIKQCELAKSLKQKKTNIRVFCLSNAVNSVYPDYSPLMLPDQSALLFTSTRKGSTGGRTTIDGGDFYEDIYISRNLSKTNSTAKPPANSLKPNDLPIFSNAENAGSLINTSANDASIAISPDGGVFYIYRKRKVWKSFVSDGKLGIPKVFKTTVLNKDDIAPSLYFTVDGKEMYFVSSRPGGYGGKDIYKAVMQVDGTWGAAQNLGAAINTSLDEESPFFDFDEQTLYFSSQGHNSIGGFDVFKSKLQKNTWSEAENLGIPLNSGTDDIFYSYDKNKNIGYYTTMRKEGIGNYDIFMVKYVQPINVSLLATYLGDLTPKNLKVTIMKMDDLGSLKTVSVNQRADVSYKSNSEYLMLIPRYNSDSILDTLYFKTPETCDTYSSLQEIVYEPMKNYRGLLIGYKTTIYNAFFDIEKEIQKSGVRNQKVLQKDFPMCRETIPALAYYKKDNLTQDEEYSKFVKYIKPDRKNLKIYTQTNYIDTSNFEMIYKIQDSLARISAMQNAGISDTAIVATPKHKSESKNESKPKDILETPKAKSDNLLVSFKPLHFDLSKSEFALKYENELNDVSNFMKENKDAFLELRGYTDSLGTERFNKVLSLDRAITVKKMIVKKGIAAERIKAEGMGEETAPIAKDEQVQAEKNNRKVLFIITNTKGEPYLKK
jgi:outer membrane protein OmpA-like peptidoglycan-associated protein/tetratricopeptide (TPR) repeat protein